MYVRILSICVQYILRCSLSLSKFCVFVILISFAKSKCLFSSSKKKRREREINCACTAFALLTVHSQYVPTNNNIQHLMYRHKHSFFSLQYLFIRLASITVFSMRIILNETHEKKETPGKKRTHWQNLLCIQFICKPDQSGKCLSCQFDHCFSNSKNRFLAFFFRYILTNIWVNHINIHEW